MIYRYEFQPQQWVGVLERLSLRLGQKKLAIYGYRQHLSTQKIHLIFVIYDWNSAYSNLQGVYTFDIERISNDDRKAFKGWQGVYTIDIE